MKTCFRPATKETSKLPGASSVDGAIRDIPAWGAKTTSPGSPQKCPPFTPAFTQINPSLIISRNTYWVEYLLEASHRAYNKKQDKASRLLQSCKRQNKQVISIESAQQYAKGSTRICGSGQRWAQAGKQGTIWPPGAAGWTWCPSGPFFDPHLAKERPSLPQQHSLQGRPKVKGAWITRSVNEIPYKRQTGRMQNSLLKGLIPTSTEHQMNPFHHENQ